MISIQDPTYAAEAERQKREAAARHHELFHAFADAVYKLDTVRVALDKAAAHQWRELKAYRLIEKRHFSAYSDQAARRSATRHEHTLRQLLGVRGALRRVERRAAREEKARAERAQT
jgi:hypothetical protein